MSEHQTTKLTAALIYKRCDPLNFKHLATTLNLILEPAKIRFRVIHEQSGQAAVLSCRKLHISLQKEAARDASATLKQAIGSRSVPEHLRSRLETHEQTIVISAGTGPLPHVAPEDDRSAAKLLPLLGQMVINHLLNMNPAEAVYWDNTKTVMTPNAFLDQINAPIGAIPAAKDAVRPKPPKPPQSPKLAPADLDRLRYEVIEKRRSETDNRAPLQTRLHPSMITGHLITDETEQKSPFSDHIRQRFFIAKDGPKAAFVLSMATLFVVPLMGILLLIYNFLAGGRLRQTALLAGLTALVTLASEQVIQSDTNATVQAPQTVDVPPRTAHL